MSNFSIVYAVERECCGHYDPDALFTTREAAQEYADTLNRDSFAMRYKVRPRTVYDAPPQLMPLYCYTLWRGPFTDSASYVNQSWTMELFDPLRADRSIGPNSLETWANDLTASQVAERLAELRADNGLEARGDTQ